MPGYAINHLHKRCRYELVTKVRAIHSVQRGESKNKSMLSLNFNLLPDISLF